MELQPPVRTTLLPLQSQEHQQQKRSAPGEEGTDEVGNDFCQPADREPHTVRPRQVPGSLAGGRREERHIGMKGTVILQHIKSPLSEKFVGLFAIDKLPRQRQRTNKFCICNTDLWDNAGKHWIVIYFPSNGPVECFDPLGQKPPSQFESFMSDDYIYNLQRIQPFNSVSCGFYCIFFAYMRCHGIPFQNVMTLFGSEKSVIRFVRMM
jgi:hypothetical protein